ncbi:unnamed protein product [Linum trigynum]|uniref:Uncharacterized protein n=1 Tax=Linum trigynum TaxID=586398 RepID=A0AAV2CVJ0_9ROSI
MTELQPTFDGLQTIVERCEGEANADEDDSREGRRSEGGKANADDDAGEEARTARTIGKVEKARVETAATASSSTVLMESGY